MRVEAPIATVKPEYSEQEILPGSGRKGEPMKTIRGRRAVAAFICALMLSTLIVLAVPAGAGACGYSTWYLPEGYTGGNFDTFVLIQNPNTCIAKVSVEFLTDTGVTEPLKFEIPEVSRYTIKVDEIPGLEDANVSTIVKQVEGSGIVVERAMYFSYGDGRAGGSNSIGANQSSASWYLAEGYTGGDFDTYILVMNPNPDEVTFKAKFIKPPVTGVGGQSEPAYLEKEYKVAGMRRFTIHVDEIEGLEDTDVSTEIFTVETTEGCVPEVVAERAMYYKYFGVDGGQASIGAPCPSNVWYLPEGRTAGEYDTYVLVMNPNWTRTHVKATFMVPAAGVGTGSGGREIRPYVYDPDPEPEPTPPPDPVPNETIVKEYVLEPFERFTIKLDEVEGLEATDVGTMIESWTEPVEGGRAVTNEGNPVVVERSMYFARGNNGDGHNTLGGTLKREYWLMAEGYTAEKFDTWLLLMNPNAAAVKVRITYMKPEGDPIEKDYEVLGMSRMTIPVDEIEGLEATEVSAKIQAAGWADGGAGAKTVKADRRVSCEYGIVAERAMYFEYNGIVGGHCSLGVGEY